MTGARVLVVDDEPQILRALQMKLRGAGYDVATAARLAREGDHWIADHRVPDPHAAELVPWSIRGPGRLRDDVHYVKRVLADLESQSRVPAGAASG